MRKRGRKTAVRYLSHRMRKRMKVKMGRKRMTCAWCAGGGDCRGGRARRERVIQVAGTAFGGGGEDAVDGVLGVQ